MTTDDVRTIFEKAGYRVAAITTRDYGNVCSWQVFTPDWYGTTRITIKSRWGRLREQGVPVPLRLRDIRYQTWNDTIMIEVEETI